MCTRRRDPPVPQPQLGAGRRAAPPARAAAQRRAADARRAARQGHPLRPHPVESVGLRLLHLPHPRDGLRVAVRLGGQCVPRHHAGGRPRPVQQPQAHDVRRDRVQPHRPVLRRRSWGSTSGATSGTVVCPTSRTRRCSPSSIPTRWPTLSVERDPGSPVAGGYSALVVQKVQSRPYTHPVQAGVRQGRLQIVHAPAALHDHHRRDRGVRGLGRGQPVQLEVRRLPVRHAAAEALHALRIRGAREDPVRGRAESDQRPDLRQGPVLRRATRPRTLTVLQAEIEGKETFTMYCYANIGVPKNPNNPYYENTDPITNPFGYNPLGTNYIDYGLGCQPQPRPRRDAVLQQRPRATSSSSGGCSRRRACATRTCGRARTS